jgi:hypothetical protein
MHLRHGPTGPARGKGPQVARSLGAVVALIGVVLTVGIRPALAWSSLREEFDNDPSGQCGNTTAMTIGLSYKSCYPGFAYDTSITSRGWQSYVRAGAYDWCYHSDPYHGGTEDFCWEDYTGSAKSNIASTVSAADLGYNADGSFTLGDDSNTAGPTPFINTTGNDTIISAKIRVNSNSHVPWYKNAGTSYTVPSGDIDMQTTLTHEFGHALGLDHPTTTDSGPGTPVMACFENYGIYNHGSADDVNGMFWHYGGENSHWGSPKTSPC